MRAAVLALVAAFGLMALAAPAQAVPTAPQDLAVSAPAPNILLVRGGCGAGWHPNSWRDRWGKWHRRCFPNRW